MTREEIIIKAKTEANKYSFINNIIDWNSIEKQLSKNLSLFTPQNKRKPLNLIEALLRPHFNVGNVFDYKSNLRLLNDSLNSIWVKINQADKENITSKLSNLSNTSFWDTAIELWLAKKFVGNNNTVKLEYPLTQSRKGFTSPNSDVAILDEENKPRWLIECISPTLDNGFEDLIFQDSKNLILEPAKAINWILFNLNKKFILKFEPHLRSLSNVKIAIIISVIKADDISGHLNDLTKIPKLPVIVKQIINCMHPNLSFGTAIRFQEINDKLDVIKLLEYFQP
ncbi:MAG: hypothetical protein Q8M94_10575 [Ignavibacteria bacterium]|nr:hypothetical protein [Ignavibacteria bacterium]